MKYAVRNSPWVTPIETSSSAARRGRTAAQFDRHGRGLPRYTPRSARLKRLRPPQVGPYLVHTAFQDITGHTEASGNIAILPAVYDPALQQDAVVCGQVPEKGTESFRPHHGKI